MTKLTLSEKLELSEWWITPTIVFSLLMIGGYFILGNSFVGWIPLLFPFYLIYTVLIRGRAIC